MENIYDYIDDHWQEGVADLMRLCRQPSISAQGVGMPEMVQLLAQMMREYGISTRILPVPGGKYPVVYGELSGELPATILFYDHYDVQPPEPLELWTSPPFEPAQREGKLFGRGVSDNKGNTVARLLALRAFQKMRGKPPISVKFLIEGEEEIGSPNLGAFVERNRRLLKADACIWECGGVNWKDQPIIMLGLKGILYVELEARGASQDVHSSMGTVVPNPAWRLVWALASIKDIDENIQIAGFYDNVKAPTKQEIQAIKAIPPDDEETKQSLGLKEFVKGVAGFDYRSRYILEPICNICGIYSGYTGPGSKTVLPCVARAKLDFRLVPDQRPDEILSKLRKHLDSHGFSDIAIAPTTEGENPARTPLDSPFVAIVKTAGKEVFGAEPVIMPAMAGSGPMYYFTDTLGLPTAGIGVDYLGSRAHAPDENIRLADFILGTKHVAALLERMASDWQPRQKGRSKKWK
ncbi:MAG: M20/M25/M40 family metallo-hydrolase [Chloroflexi bacterium]|nr:M20/M25/M40 family metallo-hydrolase [Chloroflexota bacterium]